jgi:CRP/FNR family transcriptional regulator
MITICPANVFPSRPPSSECTDCGFNAWCLPAKLTLRESKQFNERIRHSRLIKRNEYLHRVGSELTSLLVVNSGFLKTEMTDRTGYNQVTGFSMAGDLVGLDAIGTGKHQCNTTALEDSDLCAIRYSDFGELAQAIPALQHYLHRVIGAEIARDHGIMFVLGSMRAEQRIAAFLLNLAERLSARGHSGTHFSLPMTRQDIASYLGLRIETVSRAFSHFNNIRLIAANGKNIELKRPMELQYIVEGYREARKVSA